MRNSKKQFFWVVVFFVVMSAGWVSCSKTGSSYTTTPVTYLSVMNEAPYGPTMDLYLNGQVATGTNGVAPGLFSTKYGTVAPGVYSVAFKKNGSGDLLDSLPKMNYDTLNFYSLILYNDTVNHGTHAFRLHDDFSTISPNYANYRFFNLSPDASNVDLYLNDTKFQSHRLPADNADSSSPNNVFQPMQPQNYTIKVKVADDTAVLATLNNVTLAAGSVYTIMLSGLNNGSSGNKLSINVLQASY